MEERSADGDVGNCEVTFLDGVEGNRIDSTASSEGVSPTLSATVPSPPTSSRPLEEGARSSGGACDFSPPGGPASGVRPALNALAREAALNRAYFSLASDYKLI